MVGKRCRLAAPPSLSPVRAKPWASGQISKVFTVQALRESSRGASNSRVNDEASGFADLGMWQDAWEALEAMPADQRGTPEALRVRLRCCPGVGAWDIGEHLAGLLRDGDAIDREVSARFHHALAVYHARAGNVDAAKDAVRTASEVCPDIRLAMHEDPALEPVLFE